MPKNSYHCHSAEDLAHVRYLDLTGEVPASICLDHEVMAATHSHPHAKSHCRAALGACVEHPRS